MKKNNKELSIQVNLNGLSFCILNKNSNSVEFLIYHEFQKKNTPHDALPQLKSFLSSEPVFDQDFSSVTVIHQNELATVVPAELYDENNNADYLKFNSKILKSDYIAHDDLEINNSKVVYVPYVNINNFIFDTFGQFTYKHAQTIFIETVIKSINSTEDSQVYINVNKDSFELLVIKNSHLILSNIYEFYSKEDFIYYILFTFEQLNLDTNTTKVIVSGDIAEDDENYELLFKYVRHIEFNMHLPKWKGLKSLEKDTHRFFLLLNSF